MKNIKDFVKEHDIQAHLLAAVDDQGQGNWSAFEGLQTEEGVALVRVKWDGVKINFTPLHPLSPETPTLSESASVDLEEKPEEKQPEASKTSRKKRDA